VNLYPGLLAYELVVGVFVSILKTTPAADVIDEDGFEIGSTRSHVGEETLEGVATV